MLFAQLTYWQTTILQRLNRFCEHKYWRLIAVFCLSLTAIVFAFPTYDTLVTPDKVDNLVHLGEQFAHPFQTPEVSPESHQAKRVFRLSVPVFAHLTGLNNPIFYLVIQHLLGLAFFYGVIRLAERLFEDKISALMLAMAICGIYLGKSFFWDLRGWFDGIAFFFLLMSMLKRNAIVQWLCLSLAFWTDERAILASGLIWFWWKLRNYQADKLTFLNLIRPDIISFTFVLAWGLYLGLRLWMASAFAMEVPMGQSGAIGFQRWEQFIPALFTSLEGIWLLFIPLALGVYKGGNIWQGLLLLLAFGVVIVPALMVADMTRSISYAFPIIFIAAHYLHQSTQTQQLKQYLLIVALACLLFPNFTVISRMSWMHPIFPGIFVEH